MHIETKIEESYKKIIDFYGKIDHFGLDYMNMSEKQRDVICNCSFNVKQNNTINSMGVGYNSKQQHASFYYNSDIHCCTEQNIVTKIMAHEVGHIQLEEANFGLNKLSTVSDYLTNIVYSNTYMTASFFIGLGSLCLAPLQPLILLANTPTALSYALRLEEKEADKISDKILPEVKYADLNHFHMDRENEICKKSFSNSTDITFKSSDYSNKPIGRLVHLIMPHSSDYSRAKSSEKNCPVFLKEKQRLGLPSLYIQQ